MTGRELVDMLLDMENLDSELYILTDAEGNEMISEVSVEVYEHDIDDMEDMDDEDSSFLMKEGTILLVPRAYKDEW